MSFIVFVDKKLLSFIAQLSLFLRQILNSYLITSLNLFCYSSARVYTVLCASGRSNFRQIWVRNTSYFKIKKLFAFCGRSGRGVKNVCKTYEGVGVFLKGTKAYKGGRWIKNHQIWAYVSLRQMMMYKHGSL